jgi:hypothetical protein
MSEQQSPFYATVVVKLDGDITEIFHNAQVAIMAPGVVVVADAKAELGMFPLGKVRGVLYPDGVMKVVSL